MLWTVPFNGLDLPICSDDASGGPVVILGHGAGSNMEQKTVLLLSKLVREAGGTVVRFNFAYRVQGRSMPDRMPTLVATYRAIIDSVREHLSPNRLIIGGHSMGGRVASMLEAEETSANGLLLFGYPLHPAGQPEKLRDAHLGNIKIPTLQINGTEDPLCTPELMNKVAAILDSKRWTLHWVEGADHSFGVKKSSGRRSPDVSEEIRGTVANWITLFS